MNTNQTIDGVPRALLQSLYTDTLQQWGVGGNAAGQLRALLDAPVPFPGYPPVPEDRKLPAAQPQGEPVAIAQGVGVLTFMRSEESNSDACACCEGSHVFCRYFKGLPDFSDLTQDLRFRNDLEGREFKVTVEVLPLRAQQPAPVTVAPTCCGSCPGGCVMGAKP